MSRRNRPGRLRVQPPDVEVTAVPQDGEDRAEPMAVEVVAVADLHIDPANVRRHPERNMAAIKASLARFNQVKPIVIDGNNVVRAGNGTLEAARELGWATIKCVRSDLCGADMVAYSVADNRSAELAEWNEDALGATLRALQDEDFDLDAVGFTDAEVDALFGGTDAGTGNGEVGETPEPRVDEAAELQKMWGTEAGQLWLIPSRTSPGRDHRLLCGDSAKAEDVARLMDGTCAHGAFTSPPYAEQRKAQYGGTPADRYVEWWDAIQANVRDHLAPDGSFFVNIKSHCEDGERHLYVNDLVAAMKRRFGWLFVDEFCWIREGVPGRWSNRLANGFEPIFHFSLTKDIKFRPDSVAHESERTFSYSPDNRISATGFVSPEYGDEQAGMALPRNVLRIASDKSQTGSHTATFPVSLPIFFLDCFSDHGDSWYEPFLGSGTTIVAAERSGRLCMGMEILPKYVAVALQRFADMGLEPRLSD
jgi:DNA modification methylase/ParB-like chromosome segregation protein Spo0J